MKSSKLNSTTKIEPKNQLRSLSISQIRETKLTRLIPTENSHFSFYLFKNNEQTPNSTRKFSKDSLRLGHRKNIKTVIHKSSPINREEILSSFQLKPNLIQEKVSVISQNLESTKRQLSNTKKKLSCGLEVMKTTAGSNKVSDQRTPKRYQKLAGQSEYIEKIKASFQQFRENHFSILKDCSNF